MLLGGGCVHVGEEVRLEGGDVAHAGVIAVVNASRASVAVLCHTQYSHALAAALRHSCSRLRLLSVEPIS